MAPIKVDAVYIELEYNYFVEPFLYAAYADEPEVLVNTISIRYVAEMEEGKEMQVIPVEQLDVKLIGNRVLKGGNKGKKTEFEWLSYARIVNHLKDEDLKETLLTTMRNGHANFTKFVN